MQPCIRECIEKTQLNQEQVMKRFHVHVAVNDLAQSTRFYSAMFGMEPTVLKDDYAKWMLDDPRVNFAISHRENAQGLNHLGFQADSNSELEEIHARLKSADTTITAEEGVNCCYAKSDKYWVQDPSGIAWESFHSLATIPFYGEHSQKGAVAGEDVSKNLNADDAASAGCGATCCPAPVATKMNVEKPATKACCNG
jgi:catechol 2,3-dioxygenase-like lactoylglutathione lyase family enzyme